MVRRDERGAGVQHRLEGRQVDPGFGDGSLPRALRDRFADLISQIAVARPRPDAETGVARIRVAVFAVEGQWGKLYAPAEGRRPVADQGSVEVEPALRAEDHGDFARIEERAR